VPPERTVSILDTIERNAAAQMQIIEELLDLSSMAAGNLRLNISTVDLRELMAAPWKPCVPAATRNRSRFTSRRYDVRRRWRRGAPPAGAVEPARQTREVHRRPVARRHHRENREPPISRSASRSGPGIEPQFLPHVFEPFRRGESLTTRTVGGLGLGLAIVRHLVEAHGGTVTAETRRGAARLFLVRLPTARRHGTSTRDSDAPRTSRPRRGRRRIDQELVATMLLMYGVSVRTADRASEAIHILSEWRPDVLPHRHCACREKTAMR
jgi:hypothetical protein